MGRYERIIDELRTFERLCIELAADATMPEERAGLEFMANCYRAEILDIKSGNAFADTVQTHGFLGRSWIWRKLLNLLGERAGARTQDPVIKSHVLYRLSYALPWPLMALNRSPSSSVIWKSMSCRHVDASVAGKTGCFRIMLSARAV
jgi:hypothetical protein